MSEALRDTEPESGAPTQTETAGEVEPTVFDLLGGEYQDPDPAVVNELHDRKYTDPDDRVEEVVRTAFEWVGVIPTDEESIRPLEHSGLAPYKVKKGKPRYHTEGEEPSKFTELRDNQIVDEFSADDAGVNELVIRIKRATQLRRRFDDERLDSLYDAAKRLTKGSEAIPPALRMVSVMVGGKPDNELMPRITAAPQDAFEIAPDVVIMLLLEERDKTAQ